MSLFSLDSQNFSEYGLKTESEKVKKLERANLLQKSGMGEILISLFPFPFPPFKKTLFHVTSDTKYAVIHDRYEIFCKE